MGRPVLTIAAFAVLAAACGGDSGESTQEPTEQAAVDATVDAMRGTLRGDADAVLGFVTAECRETIDREELELGLLLLRGLSESDDLDLGSVAVSGEIERFDGTSATVQVTYEMPEGGASIGELMFSDDEIDVVYEDGRWVGEDCDFGDDSAASETEIDEGLAAIGVAGTQTDPVPFGQAAPVGAGFEIVLESWDPDAIDRYDAANETTLVLDDGQQFAVLEYSVRYGEDEEPRSLSDVRIEVVGSDAVAVDSTNCGAVVDDVTFSSRSIFMGGVFEGGACFAGTEAQLDGATISVSGDFFQERSVFFDPASQAATASTLTATSGPAPDGDATPDRTDPAPLGTPIVLDESWTVQVNGFEPDATAELLAESSFAEDPGPDSAYALVNVTMTYTGEDSGSPFSVPVNLVGDSNVGADDCSFITPPDGIDLGADLFNGGSVTGNVCFLIDRADTDSLVAWFRSSASFDGDPEFAALR